MTVFVEGTVYQNDGELITSATTVWDKNEDPITCQREMFDRRTASFGQFAAYCIKTQFTDETSNNKIVEIIVNSDDFSESDAVIEAAFYGEAVGRLPK